MGAMVSPSIPPYRFVDASKTNTEGPPIDEPATLSARLEAIEGKLKAFSEWARTTKEKQSILAAELASISQAPSQIGVIDTVMGYQPTPEQLISLFKALAQWQAAAPQIKKGSSAEFTTNNGREASYDYASPGEVSALARTSGAMGLSHFHREIILPNYSIIRTYLVHEAGGFIYSDVPLLTKENKLLSPIQVWAVANTAARRLGLLSVLGIQPSDSDDAGNNLGQSNGRGPSTTGPSTMGGLGTKPPPLPAENIRRIGAPTSAGPPTTAVASPPISA